jgi:mRNA interferase MazF
LERVTDMKRGDLVTIAVSGDYGKPCPALVVQANAFDALASVTVLRLTSELHDWPTFRVTIAPTPENKLRVSSQVMIDKAVTVPREKIGKTFGRLDETAMLAVSRALVAFFGLEGATMP